MSAPAILIRLELEAAPRLQVDALTEREHERIVDWIETHPEYLDLILRTLALEGREPAA
jgi:hypothetical protein